MRSYSFSGTSKKEDIANTAEAADFTFLVEQFADLKIMRFQVPGFEELTVRQKVLVYYLSQAALCGRDITFDQNGKYNLVIRRTLENIYLTYNGNKENSRWQDFVVYLKRVWFSNGIYHHYASDKFLPGISLEYFNELIRGSDQEGFPFREGQRVDQLIEEISPVMFDPEIMPKKVSLDAGNDLVLASAVNFYEGVNEAEAEAFYKGLEQTDPLHPLSFGLNSKLVKEKGVVFEKIWKMGGGYSPAIEKIVFWLEKAITVAENPEQEAALIKLSEYYTSGDLKTWDQYNVLWVKDLNSDIDVVNGFIESYEDPLGRKGSWEAMVNFKDKDGTMRAEIISSHAQWFEDNSPVDGRFKKKKVKGVSAKVITAAQLAGDCYPSTPIGINLPNADWIRKEHGSKSVTIENITYAYEQASLGNGMLEEFVLTIGEQELAREFGPLAGNVHTDLHECLGHGSGQLLPGTSSEALRNYQSTLEEARADLFALYYIMDPKMIELNILPSSLAAMAEYNSFMRNGLLTQLTRVNPGKNIEESHMRNRQLIARWCFERGEADRVVEFVKQEGKTYVKINDYLKLRGLFGELLAEIQRIKSEGDFESGKSLVEIYGVQVDKDLHEEVLTRFKKLNVAPYGGFLNPVFSLIVENAAITGVKIEYPMDYTAQMLQYSTDYSFLPNW